MSETNVSLIQDEDVLRRMWQQTEDFSKKKEIRTHMYRLREERLRNLYSPEPKAEPKGCEFTSSGGHVTSFADQNFQSMKSKEVRDAGSPPKEFTYRGQDLKEYSNAGWNVESEDSTQDGGATRVKALHATVEGRYDVEGGTGQFAASDSQRRARTEHRDDTSSLVRDETSSSTAARDHLVRTTPDGTTRVSSTTSASTTSNIKQVSSTRNNRMPDVTESNQETVRNSNADERLTRITNRSDYEQKTTRTDVDSGDLVSRKVDYPDNNTRVIVETRCLPDGTRVTSTRREFRAPAQHLSTSYSTQHHTRSDQSSTATRRVLDDRSTQARIDIVDTQRHRDDDDFKRQLRGYTTVDDDCRHSQIHRTDENRELNTERNVFDHSQTDNYSQTQRTTTVNEEKANRLTSDRNEYTRVQQDETDRISANVEETDRRQDVTLNRPDRILDVEDVDQKKITEKRVHNVTKDRKVEEVVERKTTSERYQTTYQTDYQQRKVSEDLSPTHQAWASTLRADTPSTTRPSTRASSPGSRTFQSSTSSLRSSVSPDKSRKPSSRGGSPSKTDRLSPARSVTSDRYTSTHSTYSMTETKTNKYTSPERRPPTVGRSSTSPEKRPYGFRPSPSPERRPTQSTPDRFGTSPTRSPTRPRQSPEKPVETQYPRISSPCRPFTPDSVEDRKSPNKEPQTYKRGSTSPDRKPGYMRPTAASQPTPNTKRPSKPGDEPHIKPPGYAPTTSSDRQITKVVELTVAEDANVKIRDQNVTTDTKHATPRPYDFTPQHKSPSPKRQIPKQPEPTVTDMTPQKDTIIINENDELYGRIDKTVEIIDVKETEDSKISKSVTRDYPSDRQPSPSKYDTYDKKKPRETITTETTTQSIDDTIKYDSSTHRETSKKPEPLSPTKKSLRDGTSPTKSPTKDVKYKDTTDFITTERSSEEINKKTASKNRPRQLTTPSSSPTRKPKPTEPEPLTGQSSPTTSVSGFVYFGSPRNERPLITDLDDEDEPTYDRPDTLNMRRSPTPSKIPCRSPSPEQQPLPKDSLPRKSSLKKPSAPIEPTLPSPVEKPPTSFRVSPTEDKHNISDHIVVKKDQAVGSQVKPKPPLQRRETYEDRCRKILGMVEDTTEETITKETNKYTKTPHSVQSSQSVSPCNSPDPKETSPFPELSTITTQITDNKTKVSDFISREIDENIKTTKISKNKPQSRESSPAKLQDIKSKKKSIIEDDTKIIDEQTLKEHQTTRTTRKSPSKDVPRRPSESPEKTTKQTPTPVTRSTSPTKPIPAERTSVSPTRTTSRDSPVKQTKPEDHPKSTSPTRRTPAKSSVYSTTTTTAVSDKTEDITKVKTTSKTRSRILESPTRDHPNNAREDSPKRRTDEKLRGNPEKSPTRPTTRKFISQHDTSTTERTDITKVTKSSVSPTRKTAQNQARASSPTKASPTRTPKEPESSPERKPSYQSREIQKPEKSSSPTRIHSDLPGYMKTTTSSITKRDSITTENIQDITSKRTDKKYPQPSPATSPNRKQSEPRTLSPTKTTRPTDLTKKLEKSPERKQTQQPSPMKPTAKYSTSKSPTRSSPEKVPGYMKSTTSTSSKFETSVTDVQDTFTSITDTKRTTMTRTESPRSSPDRRTPTRSPSRPSTTSDRSRNRSVSPEYKPKDSIPKTPGYMRPTESVIHKFDSLVTDVEETLETPSSERSISPDSSQKVPGYMRPTEAVIHKYDSTVTDIQGTVITKVIHRNSPEPTERSHSPNSRTNVSPENKPKESAAKIPGYMRPTEAAIHKFESTTVTEAEEISESSERSDEISVSRNTVPEIPGYMRPTEAAIHKFDSTVTDIQETITSKIVHKNAHEPVEISDSPSSRRSLSPVNNHKDFIPKTPGYMRPTEAVIHKFDSNVVTDTEVTITSKTTHRISPEPIERTDGPDLKPKEHAPKTPGYMRPTEAVTHRFDSNVITEAEQATSEKSPEPNYTHPNMRTSPEAERSSPVKEAPTKPKESTSRSTVSPDRKPTYMRPTASVTSKFESSTVTEDLIDTKVDDITIRESIHHLSKPIETRQLRTPSPAKKTTQVTDVSAEFILSEKEQEILDKVQKSLRKLSPDRKEKSPSPPSRERTPNKSTLSLEDLDISTTTETEHTHKFTGQNITEIIEENITTATKTAKLTKPILTEKSKTPSKPTSRNVSPIKRAPSAPTKAEKRPESPKSRSISPKKSISQSERPQSPQVSKVSGIRREPLHSVLTRKPTPATIKIEKLPSDIKRTNGISKQTVTVKTTSKTTSTTRPLLSPTRKIFESEQKRTPTPKGNKEPSTLKKDMTRTISDNSMKPKKLSPQRMRSKPEIQINDLSPKAPKSQKPSKVPTKPKSATALNTSMDEEDFIVDVQQSKSSRENSPDRICPTPVNFAEDVGTPRFPDEVSEPDDEYRRRTHHTIHETESVVDDIVEICEDEELFAKKTDGNVIFEEDDSVLSVTEKVTKFTNKIESVKKPKDTTIVFKDTEKRVHSDFTAENLKSDECLLSVSEKVNKFAKGPKYSTDHRSPTRKFVDEYDKDTIYQDDYTKLSVNDKAHLFVETAENIKVTKPKPAHKVERPDLTEVDESLKSDECLLSVSDKVNKFVKTAEQFLTKTVEVEVKEKKIKDQNDHVIKQLNDDKEDKTHEVTTTRKIKTDKPHDQKPKTTSSKDLRTPKSKLNEQTPTVKITTLRSSEAVKKAKALFENIASIQSKEVNSITTKLTDIGVIKKSSKTDSTTALHPSVEDISPNVTDGETEIITPISSYKERLPSGIQPRPQSDDIQQSATGQPLEVPRSKSPMRHSVEVTTSKTVLSRYPIGTRAESPSYRPESPRPEKQVPGYLKPTKTSQLKEETKVTEESEISTRRGSGKFGVELRRTSVERSTVSSERRRSVDHHQPCIEDIYDLDLLEQMLEKVTGYEQRRRIRAQIRVVKKESEQIDMTNTYTKTIKQTTHVQTSSPRPKSPARSPDRAQKSTRQKMDSPDRLKSTPQRVASERNQPKLTSYMNGHANESVKTVTVTRQRPLSPDKSVLKSTAKSPIRHSSPEKKRPVSPSKTTPKQKPNRFNEYASAYMKKVGLNETDKVNFSAAKSKKIKDTKQTVTHEKQEIIQEFATKNISERTSSRDMIEVIHINGKRSPSPEKRQSPVRKHQSPDRRVKSPERTAKTPERKAKTTDHKAQSPERIYQRTPSPDFKRPRADAKETIVKTVFDIQKKNPKTPIQDEKPSWVTNRNLKKITSETRTFSTKKIDTEKPKYRAASPSKVIAKPTDVITSSYGPGPLDADGKPLFGIKALRNGATNFQVKGTVIRQEYHSRNGGEPEGTVSVTAYSSQPEELQQLLVEQGVDPPSRLHGLSAITTTKKFGGDTGNTYSSAHTKEERARLEQFTHTDRKIIEQIEDIDDVAHIDTNTRKLLTTEKRKEDKEVKRGQKMDRRDDKKTVRQSSVKSLSEKFIKSSNDTGKVDRSSYPKAGLILRTTTLRDSASSDDNPGLIRTDSDHSLNDETFEHVESRRTVCTSATPGSVRTTRTVTEAGQPGRTARTVRTTTVVQEPARTVTRTERSFLDSNTKVTGVQDILTRMKNADIVIEDGDSTEEREARALLNKFLGASVLMAGMQGYVQEDQSSGKIHIQESNTRSSSGGKRIDSSTKIEEIDLDHCWDEQLLRKLLDECTDYEQRRRLRARIRTLMAEQEACANAVTEALGCAATEASRGDADGGDCDVREAEEVTVSSSVRRDSTEKKVSSTTTTTKTSKVVESMTRPAPKPVSPFAKFRQLEKQNSTNSPNSPKSPQSPGSPSQPYFKFTDPALQTSALTIKERLLQWCRDKTRDYENVKLENFSTSWADGLAFCALVHHFIPDAFDYSKLTPDKRRHNFTLAFKVADEKAGIYPLLDVDDMVAMRKPDWKCVFTYVQSIHRRFKDER